MPTLISQSQQLSIDGGLVELYVLDCTNIGGTVYRFTPYAAAQAGAPIYWQGQAYYTLPIQASGFEVKGDGSQSKPQLIVSSEHPRMRQVLLDLGDIVGATLTRQETWSNFLDGAEDADPNQCYAPVDYFVEQKISHDNVQFVWSLCTPIDRSESIKLPRQQVTKTGDSRWGGGFPAVGSYRPIRY